VEERRGIHLFTWEAYGRDWPRRRISPRYSETAHALNGNCKAAARSRKLRSPTCTTKRTGDSCRSLVHNGNGWQQDHILDSSMCGVFLFGMFPATIHVSSAPWRLSRESLWCKSDIGGVARYQNDFYYRISEDTNCIPAIPGFSVRSGLRNGRSPWPRARRTETHSWAA